MVRRVEAEKMLTLPQYHKTPSGFTLVEMLIVLVIMGLLASLALISFRELNSAAPNRAEIETSISLARERAAAIGKPVLIKLPESANFKASFSRQRLQAFADGSVTPGVLLSGKNAEYTVRWADGALQQ